MEGVEIGERTQPSANCLLMEWVQCPQRAHSCRTLNGLAFVKARTSRTRRKDDPYFCCGQTPAHAWPKAKAINVVAMRLQRPNSVMAARLKIYQAFEK